MDDNSRSLNELHAIFGDICEGYVSLRNKLSDNGLSISSYSGELYETIDFTPNDLPLDSEDLVELAHKTAANFHKLLRFMNKAAPDTGSSIIIIFDAMKLIRSMRSSCLLIAYVLSARDEAELPDTIRVVGVEVAESLVQRLKEPPDTDPED